VISKKKFDPNKNTEREQNHGKGVEPGWIGSYKKVVVKTLAHICLFFLTHKFILTI